MNNLKSVHFWWTISILHFLYILYIKLVCLACKNILVAVGLFGFLLVVAYYREDLQYRLSTLAAFNRPLLFSANSKFPPKFRPSFLKISSKICFKRQKKTTAKQCHWIPNSILHKNRYKLYVQIIICSVHTNCMCNVYVSCTNYYLFKFALYIAIRIVHCNVHIFSIFVLYFCSVANALAQVSNMRNYVIVKCQFDTVNRQALFWHFDTLWNFILVKTPVHNLRICGMYTVCASLQKIMQFVWH